MTDLTVCPVSCDEHVAGGNDQHSLLPLSLLPTHWIYPPNWPRSNYLCPSNPYSCRLSGTLANPVGLAKHVGKSPFKHFEQHKTGLSLIHTKQFFSQTATDGHRRPPMATDIKIGERNSFVVKIPRRYRWVKNRLIFYILYLQFHVNFIWSKYRI